MLDDEEVSEVEYEEEEESEEESESEREFVEDGPEEELSDIEDLEDLGKDVGKKRRGVQIEYERELETVNQHTVGSSKKKII